MPLFEMASRTLTPDANEQWKMFLILTGDADNGESTFYGRVKSVLNRPDSDDRNTSTVELPYTFVDDPNKPYEKEVIDEADPESWLDAPEARRGLLNATLDGIQRLAENEGDVSLPESADERLRIRHGRRLRTRLERQQRPTTCFVVCRGSTTPRVGSARRTTSTPSCRSERGTNGSVWSTA